MANEHAEIDSALDRLLDAVESGDQEIARTAFREFDTRLAAHLKLEDELLLPAFAHVDPDEAAQIRDEHRAIRARIEELVIQSDLHATRLPAIRELAQMLREHAQREDEILYPWAERTADEKLSPVIEAHASA